MSHCRLKTFQAVRAKSHAKYPGFANDAHYATEKGAFSLMVLLPNNGPAFPGTLIFVPQKSVLPLFRLDQPFESFLFRLEDLDTDTIDSHDPVHSCGCIDRVG